MSILPTKRSRLQQQLKAASFGLQPGTGHGVAVCIQSLFKRPLSCCVIALAFQSAEPWPQVARGICSLSANSFFFFSPEEAHGMAPVMQRWFSDSLQTQALGLGSPVHPAPEHELGHRTIAFQPWWDWVKKVLQDWELPEHPPPPLPPQGCSGLPQFIKRENRDQTRGTCAMSQVLTPIISTDFEDKTEGFSAWRAAQLWNSSPQGKAAAEVPCKQNTCGVVRNCTCTRARSLKNKDAGKR